MNQPESLKRESEFDRKIPSAVVMEVGRLGGMPLDTDSKSDWPGRYQSREKRWQAVEGRDRAADDWFCYAVITTGVYCRPSCPARRPLPANVEFFPSSRSAESAGYRPCRRCRPEIAAAQPAVGSWIIDLCRFIDEAPEPPTLAELAALVGRSPYHVQREFKRAIGVSPRSYAAAQRAERLRRGLKQRRAVAAAGYGAGYGSSGGLYAAANGDLGMTPSAFRAGGKGQHIIYGTTTCSLGSVLAAATERGVCAIFLGRSPDDLVQQLHELFREASSLRVSDSLVSLLQRVGDFIEAPRTAAPLLDLPLDVRGTAFQRRVWQALRDIPVGSTRSYAELARQLGVEDGARAVASACAANPVSLAIPCHRVVRRDGTLAGYRWGKERKRQLLEREGSLPERAEATEGD